MNRTSRLGHQQGRYKQAGSSSRREWARGEQEIPRGYWDTYGLQFKHEPPSALGAIGMPFGYWQHYGMEVPGAVQWKGGEEGTEPPVGVHEYARRGLQGASQPLPFLDRIQRSFGEHDVSGIRAHVGGPAAAAAKEMGALAYATADAVAFREAPDLHTAAHEAAHVVQQRAGVQLKGGVGEPGDAYERQAERVADMVVAGESAEAVLRANGAAASSTALQRKDAPQGHVGGGRQAVLMALRDNGGNGDVASALQQLESLSIADIVWVFVELDRAGGKAVLDDKALAARPRSRAAALVVRLAKPSSDAKPTEFQQVGVALAAIPGAEQSELVLHAARSRGKGGDEQTREGLLAGVESGEMPTATAQAAQPVPRGPWNPPGQQPIPFYIGNEAHVGIALFYTALHPGEVVFTNNTPLSTILGRMVGRPVGVPAEKLALRPDITNVSLRQLYEIKPLTAAGEAATKLEMYLGIFEAAGVPMSAGSSTAPGTAGVIPAPDGYYMFESPAPGIILYQYRKGDYDPVRSPERQPQRQENRNPERNEDFIRKMQELTGLTGVALVLYLIVSEGSRLFPPRNFVPVP